MPDPNVGVRLDLDRQLYQAVCKGVSKLGNNHIELVFEKDGETLELSIVSDRDGIDARVSRRRS